MAQKEKSFYQRLTRLFRSGPAIRRKIRGQDYKNFYDNQVVQNNLGYYGAAGFKREASPFSVMGAYGILDRMSRYAEFAEMENCLHGDTKIAVPGGYKTLKQLTEEYGLEKEFIVYSYDHNKKAIVPAVARQARHTTTTHAYRVVFDNGKEIVGTEDHRLMKRDGTYCEIRDLKPGDAMMPFYRRSLVGKETGPELQDNCYQLIYTMNKEDSPSRWIAEHRLLGKFVAGRSLELNEVVHHKNFKAHDNRLENLEIMTETDHQALHAKTLNGKKWDKETNHDWIAKFKERHSAWMKENNPAERKDIKFERILQWCDENSFNLYAVARAFDTDINTIKRKLKTKGFENFVSFAKAYCSGWKPYNGENQGANNNRYLHDLTFEKICNAYSKGLSQRNLAKRLNVSVIPINARLKENGFNNWKEFASTYENLKVVNVEYYGVTDLYDITVDGFKNFATDSLIAHNTADIATALNVYADESCATDENGRTFHIYSDVPQIQRALEELFYDVMNIEFNARRMVRNLVKNGDYFMYVEVVPDYGVINVEPLPVNEVEREEGFDKHDPYAVRFRLITRGGKYLENWQMLHFRILGNDLFLPYGTSFLESARRPWRQLTMMEDSMLVYRLVRSPERRVFYVDVSAVHPNDIPSYMEAVKESMRGASVIEQQTGRQDFRYNPLAIDEDYFLPTRPNNQTKIESLAGGQNATAIEDVEYIHKKLIAALMVPKAYLTYDEAISSKATLAQEDIRFSRTVGQLQKILIAELNKLAMIHLYALGFSGDDLLNFDLKFSNPSTVAVQQKLALISSKLEIAAKALELSKETGLLSFNYIQTEILSLRPEQINIIKQEARQDQVTMAELKKIAENPPFDKSIDSNIDIFDKSNYEVPTSPYAPDKKEVRKLEQQNQEQEQEYQARRAKEREEKSGNNSGAPIRFSPTPNLDKSFRKSRRSKAFTGDRALVMPDFKKMLDITNNRYSKDPFDTESIRKFVLEENEMEKDLFGVRNRLPYGISKEMQTSLRKLNESLFPHKQLKQVEVVSEKAESQNVTDELFLIEKELKSE
jgi:transcriptional regulator with XRE-family HTH domain